MTTRSPHSLLARLAPVLIALLLAVSVAGCGYDYDYFGYVYLLNSTGLTTNELVLTFFIAPDGVPFGGDFLSMPLSPGDEDYIGEFDEDWYDAESDLEFGDLTEWFDIWVGDYDDAVFEVV
jgi:hypothetical protein